MVPRGAETRLRHAAGYPPASPAKTRGVAQPGQAQVLAVPDSSLMTGTAEERPAHPFCRPGGHQGAGRHFAPAWAKISCAELVGSRSCPPAGPVPPGSVADLLRSSPMLAADWPVRGEGVAGRITRLSARA